MAEQATAGDEQQLKQRAMRRLALALALIAAAIVGLGLLDHYSGRKKAVMPGVPATEPPPIAALPQPKPLEPAEPPSPTAQTPAAVPTPPLPPPPPPTVEDRAAAPSQAGQTRAQPPAASAGLTESTVGAAPARAKPSAAVDAGNKPRTAPESPSGPGTGSALEARQGFVVQVGVFTTVDNAQALQTKLKDQGIPAFLETRLVVGPFRDRAEAEAAQRKLKELGVGGVIVQRK